MPDNRQNLAYYSRMTGEPRDCYQQWRGKAGGESDLLLVDFQLQSDWLEGAPSQPLTAVYCLLDGELQVSVTEQRLGCDRVSCREQYDLWLQRHQLLCYAPGQALELESLPIAKPWGQEIWYTGVERRGVSRFSSGGRSLPIPWLQAVLPEQIAGVPSEPLLLLKVLAPSNKPVQGDLYFELHLDKHEAYVVTHVDPEAWPGGVGYIRYGFNPQQRAVSASDKAFRAAYLQAVLSYESQRRKVDELLDNGRKVPAPEQHKEQTLRAEMDSFTQLMPLKKGDVVQVTPLLPHALQHGVRVIEIQTATYERKILSFAQKVLTQNHWDTREAVAIMRLEPPAPQLPAAVPGPTGANTESIVDCSAFDVSRVRVSPGRDADFTVESDYCLLMVIAGELAVENRAYPAERALLLPRGWRGKLGATEGAGELVFLLARPCG